MAWPTKPSATMQVPRRAEPYATAQMKARWTADVLPKYATRLGALMPSGRSVPPRTWERMAGTSAIRISMRPATASVTAGAAPR